ncbi:MAG: hypothetical protein U1F23_01255 [Lysobacterales bacterium]
MAKTIGAGRTGRRDRGNASPSFSPNGGRAELAHPVHLCEQLPWATRPVATSEAGRLACCILAFEQGIGEVVAEPAASIIARVRPRRAYAAWVLAGGMARSSRTGAGAAVTAEGRRRDRMLGGLCAQRHRLWLLSP